MEWIWLQCPDSASKQDLLAYLQRIALYCHQLNITSKVKADVQNISGELIVSGVSLSLLSVPPPLFVHRFILRLFKSYLKPYHLYTCR